MNLSALIEMEEKQKGKNKKNKKQLKKLFNGQSSLTSPIVQKQLPQPIVNDDATSEDLIRKLDLHQ
jgi:hypothetical protein